MIEFDTAPAPLGPESHSFLSYARRLPSDPKTRSLGDRAVQAIARMFYDRCCSHIRQYGSVNPARIKQRIEERRARVVPGIAAFLKAYGAYRTESCHAVNPLHALGRADRDKRQSEKEARMRAWEEAAPIAHLACYTFAPGWQVESYNRWDALNPGDYDRRLFYDPTCNYRSSLFIHKKTEQAVLCFDMTHWKDLGDWPANLEQSFGLDIPRQYLQAAEAAGALKPIFGKSLCLAGYSKGANMAMYAALMHEIPYISYAATGLSDTTREHIGPRRCARASELGRSFSISGDILASPFGDDRSIGHYIGERTLGTSHLLDPDLTCLDTGARKLPVNPFLRILAHDATAFPPTQSGRLPSLVRMMRDPRILQARQDVCRLNR